MNKTAEKQITLSQSLIKAYQDYIRGERCGIQFEHEYILNEISTMDSHAMRLGKYFEYVATGQLPRDGVVPEPERTQKGELKADWQKAYDQGIRVMVYMQEMGIKIVETGKKAHKKLPDGTLTDGEIDIIAKYQDKYVVIDLKYSGLMENKWDPLGWDIGSLQYKEKHMLQAVHYHYLTGLPFYFLVADSGKNQDCKFIRVHIDPDSLLHHEHQLMDMQGQLKLETNMGFTAYPELVRCRECPLFSTCEHKTTVPIEKAVYYSMNE